MVEGNIINSKYNNSEIIVNKFNNKFNIDNL